MSQVFRPRLRAAVGPSLVALLGIAAFLVPIALGISTQPEFEGRGFGRLLIIWENLEWLFLLTPALAPVVKVLTTRYVLEETGLREEVRFLNTTERRVQWEKVTALRQRRGLLDRMLGIERLDVIAYGQRGATIHLIGLTEVAPLRTHLAQKMRESATVEALFRTD